MPSLGPFLNSQKSQPHFLTHVFLTCGPVLNYVTNTVVVGMILFFLFFVEESSERAAKTIACPCRKHVNSQLCELRIDYLIEDG